MSDDDTKRFDWFFGPSDKTAFLQIYIEGAERKWTPDKWRHAIDQAMREEMSRQPQPMAAWKP